MSQDTEYREALAAAKASTPEQVEPTDEERRNGWTAETLTAYVLKQTAAQALRIDPLSALNRRARRPTECNNIYRPFRWR